MGFLKNLLIGAMNGQHGSRKRESGHHGSSNWSNPNFDNSSINNRNAVSSCPHCKTGNSDNAQFCQQCGTSLAMPICTQCKTSLLADAKFCPQCGKARI